MTEYNGDYITVDGVRLHYYDGGSGDTTVILLHGATDNGMCWKRVADRLTEKYRVIMPDAQGHGLSDRLGTDFDYLDHARQVAGLVQELGIRKPVLAGHSMGAGTAVNAAALYPDLPKAVILEDPGWGVPPAVPVEKGGEKNDFARQSAEMTHMPLKQLIARCRAENPSWHDEEILPWAEAKQQFDPSLFSVIQIGRPSYRETVPKIKCPGLLFTAENGIVSDDIAAEAMAIWTAEKPLHHIKVMGAGHNIRREQYRTFLNAVVDFLNNL